jgi:hypothetical protein
MEIQRLLKAGLPNIGNLLSALCVVGLPVAFFSLRDV